MVGPARPSLDVEASLDDAEWLELYRESLRATSFWPRLQFVGAVLVAGVALTSLLGAPLIVVAVGALLVVALLGAFAAGFAWLGPRRRCRRLDPADRSARWRISADRISTDQGGELLDLTWRDVDRVRVTRRLVTFELTGGRGLLALPRRTATDLGESLVLGWATEGGTPVSRARK